MKHPKPDIGDSIRSEFISNISTIRKLLKYWGTTTVLGTSVLQQRKYYYPTSYAVASEKLFRLLNMYNDVTQTQMEGIDSAWVYFNKSKENASSYTVAAADFVLHNLNLVWWDPRDGARPDGLTLTTTIVIEGLFQDRYTGSSEEFAETTPLLDVNWTTPQLITALSNNYDTIWNTALVSQQGVGVINKGSITDPVTKIVTPDEDDLSPNDPWLAAVARYALRTNGIPYTIKDIEVGLARVESDRLYSTYVVTIELPFTTFTSGMGIVTDITADITATTYTSANRKKLTYPNGYYTKQAIRSLGAEDLETDITLITRPYMPWDNAANGAYEALWQVTGGEAYTITSHEEEYTYYRKKEYYLKADVLSNPRAYGLTYKELINYLLPLLDTGYKKKKVSWWKKLIAIIVFVVAVVFAPVSGGGSLGLAKAVLFGIIVVTIASFVLSQLGATEWAMAFAEVNKAIEPLAWVAMIFVAWTGITAAYTAAKEAAVAAAKTAATEAALEAGIGTAQAAAAAAAEVTAVDVLLEAAKTVFTNQFDFLAGGIDFSTTKGLGQGMKLLTNISKIFNTVQEMKLESINNRNSDLAAEYEKLTEDSALENDILQGFARISASPATADWSIFASLFDLPYEPTGGALHQGCSQRTTKQALRKTTYDDYPFNDILIIG